ncbi:N-acetyltransferase [Devosia sp.]|uniref:GNAT family N-acetyltransferase n=1 Tax=Devosia sp. TaxID=1871048 RepID=UPI001B2C6341|nr:N-acetyltransferase [Devosia sp.]MBO9587456.1 GNAT family N-acetyltransferase [Devosia sp.]
MSGHIRLRKLLDAPVSLPALPHGVVIDPLHRTRPIELHALLRTAYANGGGTVGDFDSWWWPLVEDEEFDPALVIVATTRDTPVGLIQCWTSCFVKDLVVAPLWRNQSLGTYLLNAAFLKLQQRGAPHVDLKVEASNLAAQRFYRRHGMVEVGP